MKIRIVYDPSDPLRTRIEDADTGEVIPGVRTVSFSHRAHDWPVVTLEFIKNVSVEVVAEGTLEDVTTTRDKYRRMRLVEQEPPAYEVIQ